METRRIIIVLAMCAITSGAQAQRELIPPAPRVDPKVAPKDGKPKPPSAPAVQGSLAPTVVKLESLSTVSKPMDRLTTTPLFGVQRSVPGLGGMPQPFTTPVGALGTLGQPNMAVYQPFGPGVAPISPVLAPTRLTGPSVAPLTGGLTFTQPVYPTTDKNTPGMPGGFPAGSLLPGQNVVGSPYVAQQVNIPGLPTPVTGDLTAPVLSLVTPQPLVAPGEASKAPAPLFGTLELQSLATGTYFLPTLELTVLSLGVLTPQAAETNVLVPSPASASRVLDYRTTAPGASQQSAMLPSRVLLRPGEQPQVAPPPGQGFAGGLGGFGGGLGGFGGGLGGFGGGLGGFGGGMGGFGGGMAGLGGFGGGMGGFGGGLGGFGGGLGGFGGGMGGFGGGLGGFGGGLGGFGGGMGGFGGGLGGFGGGLGGFGGGLGGFGGGLGGFGGGLGGFGGGMGGFGGGLMGIGQGIGNLLGGFGGFGGGMGGFGGGRR